MADIFQCIVCFILTVLLASCIGDYIIEDIISEEIRITNPLDSITVGNTYQFGGAYFNNIGVAADANLSWSSDDPDICSIDLSGLATAISPGSTTINLSLTTTDNEILSVSDAIVITEHEIIEQIQMRTGNLMSTSSYVLTGNFNVSLSAGNLIISLDESYKASSSLPGLYVYLTNNPNSTNGAFEVGRVITFDAAHAYTLATSLNLNSYSHLLYYCKPFGVKVGDGALEN